MRVFTLKSLECDILSTTGGVIPKFQTFQILDFSNEDADFLLKNELAVLTSDQPISPQIPMKQKSSIGQTVPEMIGSATPELENVNKGFEQKENNLGRVEKDVIVQYTGIGDEG